MIEITHQNAQRLIRRELDTSLQEGQWSLLAAHLETCAACREYRQRLRGSENGLRRSLRSGWGAFPGPVESIAASVAALRARRARLRRRATGVVGALAALGIFLALGGPGWAAKLFSSGGNSSPQAIAAEPANPGAGNAAPGDFPGELVFEARRDGVAEGDMEIYLLRPGSGPVSLSSHAASDTAPAWSPDGEWVAFLSDRTAIVPSLQGRSSRAKTELWVTEISGGRTVQLTAEPGVTWQEPLSWSPDGRWIAVTGRREGQGGQSWIYLVPLDGSPPRALAGTRGAGSPKFSPVDPNRLAFSYTSGDTVGLRVLLLNSGQWGDNAWSANPLAALPHTGAGFDWSPDGGSLAYIVGGSPDALPEQSGSRVLAVEGLSGSGSLLANIGDGQVVARSSWPSAYRAVSWTPDGAVAYLEAQSDARARRSSSLPAEECWQLRTRPPGSKQPAGGGFFTAGDLCLEGGFDQNSWTSDGRWLVATGRRRGESQRAVYAVRLTAAPAPGEALTAAPDRLIQLAGDPGTLHPPRVRPVLQPGAAPLAIDPRPTWGTRVELPPSDLTARPGGPPGQLVYAVQNNAMSVVVSTNPDGTGGRVLYASSGLNLCPRWSPDGRQVAMISYARREPQPSAGGGGHARVVLAGGAGPVTDPEIYVLGAEGGHPRKISSAGLLPEAGPQPVSASYHCPVWSPAGAPGGPYVAAVVSTARGSYLAVLPVNGGRMRFTQVVSPSPEVEPVWSADGRKIYLAQKTAVDDVPRVGVVTLPQDPRLPLSNTVLPARMEWEAISGMLVSPNSPLLYLLTLDARSGSQASVSLFPVSAAFRGSLPRGERAPERIGQSYISAQLAPVAPAWLSDGSLGLVLHGGPTERFKTRLVRYDLAVHALTILAEVEDQITGAAWSPDGRWLVYSTESGLWGLDITAARGDRAGPVWLSPLPVQGMDWR